MTLHETFLLQSWPLSFWKKKKKEEVGDGAEGGGGGADMYVGMCVCVGGVVVMSV